MLQLKKGNLKNKIFRAFILMGFFPLIMMAFVSYYNTSRVIDSKVSASIQDNIDVMARFLDDSITNLESIADYIAENKEIQNILKKKSYSDYEEKFNDVQKIYTIINSIEVRRMDIPIYVMGLNNPYSRFTTQQYFEEIYSNEKGYAFKIFEEMEEDKNFYIHRRVDGKESKDVVLTIIRRIRKLETDEVLGYVFLDVYDDYFNDIFKKAEVYEGNNIYILNRNGLIITDKLHKNKTAFKFYDGYIEDVLNNESGKFNGTLNGERQRIYFNTLSNTKFKIVETVPRGVINRDRIIIIKTFLILVVCLGIIAVVTSFVFSNRISRPVNELCKLMNKVEKGEFNVNFDIECDDEDINKLGRNFNAMIKEIDRLIEEVYVKQYLLKEAELENLKAQINPHFLYNTLESIKWMARLGDNKGVAKMTTTLGKFLRYSINKKGEMVTVEENMKQIKNYLTIQEIRYQDKFTVVFDVDDEIMEINIPKLLIQPLVENAIIHGLEPKSDSGELIIRGYKNRDNICFDIIDNGEGITEKKSSSTGIGMSNVDKRIKLHYGEEYGVELERIDNRTHSKLILPYKNQGDEKDDEGNDC